MNHAPLSACSCPWYWLYRSVSRVRVSDGFQPRKMYSGTRLRARERISAVAAPPSRRVRSKPSTGALTREYMATVCIAFR